MSKKIKIALILVIVSTSVTFFIIDGQNESYSSSTRSSSSTLATIANTQKTSSLPTQGPLSQNDNRPLVDVAGKLPVLPSISSLEGTRIHGNLRVDDQGNLIIDKDIKKLLHYFLNLEGEIPRDQLIALLKAGIADYLPQPAEGQALEILTQYLAYQNALQEQVNQGMYQLQTGVEGYREAFDLRNQLRIQYLGAEVANAFFADEEAYDLFTVTRLELNNDPSLSEAERSAQLSVLEDELPEQYLNVRKKQQSRLAVNEEIQTLKDNNASIYELQNTWEQHYGAEAAQRLVALEESRQEWQNRYDEYSSQRQSLLAAGLDDSALASELSALQRSMFTETEQKRVDALDKINNTK